MKNLTLEKIYEILNDKMECQRQSDLLDICAKYTGEELYNEYRYLEIDYELYEKKLEFVCKVKELDKENQEKYIANINEMLNMENITPKQRMKMLLSYGVLVNYFGDINKLSFEELSVIAVCSGKLDLEDYSYYVGVLSNENVSKSIINISDDFDKQTNMAYDIMDAQDTLPYDFITKDNYLVLINNALSIIQKKSKEK